MKNTIISMFLLALISCNKKEQSIQNIQLVEMTELQISELITPKQNDTIYVTNFFATWCGPCMKEIPHFKEKMQELRNDKVKFTFVSVDNPNTWSSSVNDFALQSGLGNSIVLFNAQQITPDFLSKNFASWDGQSIPFTLISKGSQSKETIGMMSKDELSQQINSFK